MYIQLSKLIKRTIKFCTLYWMLIITKRKKGKEFNSSSLLPRVEKKTGEKRKLFHISIVWVQLLNKCISYPNHAQLIFIKIKYIWETSGLGFFILGVRSCHSILISKKLNRLQNHLFLDPSERRTQGKSRLEREENTGNRSSRSWALWADFPWELVSGWKP